MSANYNDFSNRLSIALSQKVAGTEDKPITLKDIEKCKSNQGFFVRSLNMIKGKNDF